MKQSRFIPLLLILLALGACSVQKNTDENYVVVLSMDGFRWDYADRAYTPNLDAIAAAGVKAEYLQPSFPTTTFANHYTLATGLYPDKHGILFNRFFDPETGRTYNDRNDRESVEDGSFYGGEPIWVTAENQNVTTATCFWVGSEAAVKGVSPTYWKRYQHNMPFIDRIDTVAYWLGLPKEKRPRLVMWYMDEPDSKGHTYGPENDSLMSLVTYLDSLVGVLISRIDALPHKDKINIIVVSDHGMGQLSPDRQVILDQFIDTSLIVNYNGWNPTISLQIKDGMLDKAMEQLAKAPNVNVYARGAYPERLHFGNHPRTLDLTVVANEGYSLYWSWAIANVKGTHGYDNEDPAMRAIFYAKGPDFKENYQRPAFQNIHLYPLLAKLLNLQAAETDGQLDAVIDMLKTK